jgi:hypothetical protein
MIATLQHLPKRIRTIVLIPIVASGISFIIGTIIFLLYYIEKNSPATNIDGYIQRPGEFLIYIGAAYTFTAFVINSILLLVLAICSFIYREYRFTILKYTSLLLVNIPVVALYLYLLFIYDTNV